MQTPERYNDIERNRLLNKCTDDLHKIINDHNPEIDVPIFQGVWDRLDKLAQEVEARAL